MILVTLMMALAGTAHAQTADEVVAKARAANQVESSIQAIRMTIINDKGRERVRELESRSRRDDDTVRSFLEFQSPSDVAGMRLLMIDHPDKSDELLVFLPAYSQVNRISGNNRKSSFVGSDFTYEDMEIRQAADGAHTLVEQTDAVWVIDTVPTDSIQYAKIRTHISKSDLLARKVEFFDLQGQPFKVLEVSKTAQSGALTIPTESVMKNLKKGSQTRLEITSHDLNIDLSKLPADTFTPAYLER